MLFSSFKRKFLDVTQEYSEVVNIHNTLLSTFNDLERGALALVGSLADRYSVFVKNAKVYREELFNKLGIVLVNEQIEKEKKELEKKKKEERENEQKKLRSKKPKVTVDVFLLFYSLTFFKYLFR